MNTKAKHTPGPWTLNGEANVNGDIKIAGGSYDCVAVASGDWKEEIEANAALIAAAPELLAALEGMLEWARRVKALNPGLEVGNALNAIRKAEGGD